MKRLLCTLLLLPALAAAKVPDEEDIVLKTIDSSSPYYLTVLLMRFDDPGETLTEEEYHYLYYGYAYHENYKPLESNPDMDRVLLMASGLDPDRPNRETLEELLVLARRAAVRDPFSPKLLNLMAFAHGALGHKAEEKAAYDRMQGIVGAILASGDGLTQGSAHHILMFDHAYDVLAAEGMMNDGRGRVVSRSVEFVPLASPRVVDGKKRKGFYFDFSRIYRNKPEGYTYKRDRTWQFNNLKPRVYK